LRFGRKVGQSLLILYAWVANPVFFDLQALDYYRRVAQAVAEEVSFSGGSTLQRVRLQVGPINGLYLVQGMLRGKYHCTIDLLFDWFGISCMTTDNFCFYLQNRLIQASKTGGQRYSDTSPL